MDVDADGLEVGPRAGEEADDAAVVEDGDGEGRAGAVAERPDGALAGDELERGDDVGVVPDGPHEPCTSFTYSDGSNVMVYSERPPWPPQGPMVWRFLSLSR